MNREDFGNRFVSAIRHGSAIPHPGPEWFTVKELAELSGYSYGYVYKQLMAMTEYGSVERIKGVIGRGGFLYYYRLIEPSEGSAPDWKARPELAIPRSDTFRDLEIPTTLGFIEM